ncbi:hypothetical protein VTN49DRAFT_3574 [Thermomyces lanuginosus]|uniref:uncharacterized protein n=1 Tax=Thermomyces lanuginosus TaxID=5541 RepID=UPI00374221F6
MTRWPEKIHHRWVVIRIKDNRRSIIYTNSSPQQAICRNSSRDHVALHDVRGPRGKRSSGDAQYAERHVAIHR